MPAALPDAPRAIILRSSTLMNWFLFWLLLHVAAAIIAFGPTFVFPLVGSLVPKMPQHTPFALAVNAAIEDKLVIPFALTMPISGLGMAYCVQLQWQHNVWLIAALVLYTAAMVIAIFVQRPIIHRLIHMAQHMGGPPAGAGAASAAPMPAGPGAAPAGPPPEFVALVNRTKKFGMLLTVFLLTIIVLMVLKPGGNVIH
jgi:Predicted integral membrane protein (DUF2269)